MINFIFKTKDLEESAFYFIQPGVSLDRVESKDGLKRKVIWFVFSFPMTEDEFYDYSDYLNPFTNQGYSRNFCVNFNPRDAYVYEDICSTIDYWIENIAQPIDIFQYF